MRLDLLEKGNEVFEDFPPCWQTERAKLDTDFGSRRTWIRTLESVGKDVGGTACRGNRTVKGTVHLFLVGIRLKCQTSNTPRFHTATAAASFEAPAPSKRSLFLESVAAGNRGGPISVESAYRTGVRVRSVHGAVRSCAVDN